MGTEVTNEMFLKVYGDIDEVINHLKNNVKTELRPSPIHGIGVFAIKDIKEGENLFPVWERESGIYIIPNDRIDEIPKDIFRLLDMYFINDECGYKVIRLFKGFNLLYHSFSFCNSAYPNKENTNINNKGYALRDINAGEEILEWYTENINLEN